MMTWVLVVMGIAVLFGLKVLHDAQVDDKQRKAPRKKGVAARRPPPPRKR